MEKLKVTFEEGCFDEMGDMTQEEMDLMVASIKSMFESGEFFENAIPVSELPIEEQIEIAEILDKKSKNTRQ
jgi:hypothetical protein